MSDMGSEIQKVIPHTEALQAWLKQLSEDILDKQVVKTDMKLRQIFTESLEVRQHPNPFRTVSSILFMFYSSTEVKPMVADQRITK